MRRATGWLPLLGLLAALPAAGAPPVKAAEPSAKNIYLYRGADRAQKLINGAKREGALTIYTTLNQKDAAPLTEAFEKKYGVKITLWRSGAEKLVQRALAEARAGKHAADVLEGNGPGMEMLYREKLLEEFYSPAFADIPAEAFPRHRHYAPDNLLFFVMGYNTNFVKPDEVPNSYEDLLDPKWTGKLGIEATDIDWFAAVVTAMGEEKGLAYFKKLSALRPQMRNGHTLMAELVATGDIPIALTLYNQNAEGLKKKGAPIDWRPLPPAFGRTDAIGVTKRAPHPHAALLFVDFVLSKEGQQIIQSRERVPVSKLVDSPLRKFDYRIMDIAAVLDDWDKWEKHWDALFLKPQE